MASKSKLPKRFQPLLQQANTETDIRYGAQESALQSILNSLTQDYGQQSQAADTASRSLAGLLQGAGSQLQQSYTDAGLTPNVMAQIANSPTGQRLAGELAREQASIQQQQLGAQAGAAYQQQHLHDQYLQNVGKVQDQAQALVKERGEYGADLLNQLISGDRSARHAANQELRNQAFQTKQQQAQEQASLTNTVAGGLIGQGIQPVINSDGSISVGGPIPGGKADPNSPLNATKKPKRTSGPGTASADAQRTYGTQFQSAVAKAQDLAEGEGGQPDLVGTVAKILSTGQKASSGQPVYQTVKVIDQFGRDTGKTKQVRVLNADGTPKLTGAQDAIPSYDQAVAQAAAEQAVQGYVATKTVRALQKLGYSVNAIPGLVTQTKYDQAQRAKPRAVLNRPGTAPSRAQQPG